MLADRFWGRGRVEQKVSTWGRQRLQTTGRNSFDPRVNGVAYGSIGPTQGAERPTRGVLRTPGVVVVVVVGLQESHLLWYGLQHGSDPPSPPLYHRLAVGVENGHRFSF